MAKKIATPVTPEPTTTTTVEPTKQPGKVTQRLIDAVREPFMNYLGQYTGLQATRTRLAPQFMKAFNAWAAETEGSFVAFVRLFDPSVPTRSDEYRNHQTYQSAEYLKRRANELAQRREREEAGEPVAGATGIGAEAPATPITALARFVAMVLPLIAFEDQSKIWEFFETDFGWTKRRVDTLKGLVESPDIKPFATVRTEKGQPRPQLHLVHARGATKTGTTG